MPASPRETVLCRYRYDALDHQADCTLFEEPGIQRFYCKTRLATEIQGAVQCSIFQHEDQLLAQRQSQSGKVDTTLLATDQQRSVLNALDATRPHPLAYTPYGHRPLGIGLLSLLGFNGERPDPVTGHYHLGNGYRQFNPVLMRFNSPDSWSPFGEGGLNAYVYCDGKPILRRDPTGHSHFLRSFWKGFKNRIGIRTPSKANNAASVSTLNDAPQQNAISTPATASSSQPNQIISAEALNPNADLVGRLNMLKGRPTHSSPHTPRVPNTTPNNSAPSAFGDSVEYTATTELIQQKASISAWPTSSTERNSMISTIDSELYIRSLNHYDPPHISNRKIRT